MSQFEEAQSLVANVSPSVSTGDMFKIDNGMFLRFSRFSRFSIFIHSTFLLEFVLVFDQ